MRRSRWRLAALISGSTAAALRAPVSHAQAALARCRRSPAAGISFLLNHHIPPTPIRASAFIGRHRTIRKNSGRAAMGARAFANASRRRWRGPDGSLCYYAAHDTCRSNLRIAEAAGGGTTARVGNFCQYLRFEALPDRRQESFVVRVRRFTLAGYRSGTRAAAPEYCSNEEGQLARAISTDIRIEEARQKWLAYLFTKRVGKKVGPLLGNKSPLVARHHSHSPFH